jgi:hypothetical protein
MQSMAKCGLLPKKLAKCQIPACTSCLYGRATRRPWRTKSKLGQQGGKLRTAMEPGQCISVDQLESTTPGLIAQIKGWLTKKRYRVATIFVDHFSGLSYQPTNQVHITSAILHSLSLVELNVQPPTTNSAGSHCNTKCELRVQYF